MMVTWMKIWFYIYNRIIGLTFTAPIFIIIHDLSNELLSDLGICKRIIAVSIGNINKSVDTLR